MRKIKYRAWDETEKFMGDVLSIDFEEESISMDTRYSDDQNYFKFDEVPVMQFTGLYAQNGQPIYEGDIIQFHHEENEAETKEKSPVTWFGDSEWEYPAFDLDGSKLKKHHFENNVLQEIVTSGLYKFEIIGNIYENPELVK